MTAVVVSVNRQLSILSRR